MSYWDRDIWRQGPTATTALLEKLALRRSHNGRWRSVCCFLSIERLLAAADLNIVGD